MFALGAFPFGDALISKSDFFRPQTRKKFGCIYEIHNFRCSWIGGTVLLKRGMNALLLGLLGPIVGPIGAIIVTIVYIIFIVIKNFGEAKPYLDPISFNFDITHCLDFLLSS